MVTDQSEVVVFVFTSDVFDQDRNKHIVVKKRGPMQNHKHSTC